MVRWLGAACLMTMVAAPAFAQSVCNTNLPVSALHARQAQLAEGTVEEMSTEVPELMRSQLSGLKNALAATVEAQMHCTPAGADAATIQAQLAKLMGANQPAAKNAPAYGSGVNVAVAAPANAPQLRAVTVSYSIECGDDSLLLLYEPGQNGWRRIIKWQSPEYATISDAFGDFFQYAVVPGTPVKVAVAHGAAWCTSRFSGFKMDLLEATGADPRLAWHIQRPYSRGDFNIRMRSTADGFELRLNAVALDINGFERTVIYRYRVDGDQVERVTPIATDGRGFVEEWLAAPWDEAKGQTAPDAEEAMKAVHERQAQLEKSDKTYVTYTYGPVRSCTVKGRFEVEMDAAPGGPQFYAIQQRSEGDGYTMVNFGTTQDERCSGPDLMKK
jgi:hypothetical protein